VLTAAAFAREITDDPEAAVKKYGENPVLIEGVIASKKTTGTSGSSTFD
jgi:hypothetical protein